jgi:zinc protease
MKSTLYACVLFAILGGPVTAQVRNWPSESPPGPLKARDIKFPPYELQTLPNGLQVVAVLHHQQPAVSMRLLIRAGTAQDSAGKLGVAHMAASLVDQGVDGASAQEMNDAIDFIGGEMGAGAGTDLTSLHTVVMKDSFETGLRMLSDMARHPTFAPDEVERQRQQMLSGLKVSLEDPEYIANSVFDRLVYGFHPYGMPESGTSQTIAGLTREDLVAFHRRYFVPNNALLAIVGDVTADEAFDAAKKVFGDWQKIELAPEKLIPPPDPTRRVIVVNKPDSVQTEVRVGHIGIQRNHPDYMAVNLAIRILGGEGSNRLHQVLRTERGLTYGAQANMDTLKETGDFEAETNTRSEATGEVLRLIVDEFWRLQRERVGDHELADAKAYLTGSFPLTIETPENIAMQVVTNLFYGLPLDELQNFRDRVNAVSVDDIQRVARAYLRPDRLSVVLVGNASAFTSQLRGVGFASFETVELADLDLTSATFKRGATRTGPSFNPGGAPVARLVALVERTGQDDSQKAAELLDRAIAAKGGLEKLRGAKTIIVKQTLISPSPDNPANKAQVETVNYIEYPDHFRIETPSIVQGYDGKEAWMEDQQRVYSAPPSQARDARLGLRRDPILLLLAAKQGTLVARLQPDANATSGRLEHALEISGRDLNPVVLYIDSETGLINRQQFSADAPGRPLVEEEFSDYRPVDGIQIAYRAIRKVGTVSVERQVTDIKINAPIDPALFKKPAGLSDQRPRAEFSNPPGPPALPALPALN